MADLKSYTSWEELCMEAEERYGSMARLRNIVEKKQTEKIEKLAARQARARMWPRLWSARLTAPRTRNGLRSAWEATGRT